MLIVRIEPSLSALYTAVFDCFKRVKPDLVTSDEAVQIGFYDRMMTVAADPQKAARIERAAMKGLGYAGFEDFKQVALCSDPRRETALFGWLTLFFEEGRSALANAAHPAVALFRELHQKVTNEIHRLKGFVRFQACDNGFYYAQISPDHNVTAQLMPFFANRFGDQPFLLHDVVRNLIGVYANGHWKLFAHDGFFEVTLSEEESAFADLFRRYYRSVNIPGRKNLRQQDNYLPRRYRRNMPETWQSTSFGA